MPQALLGPIQYRTAAAAIRTNKPIAAAIRFINVFMSASSIGSRLSASLPAGEARPEKQERRRREQAVAGDLALRQEQHAGDHEGADQDAVAQPVEPIFDSLQLPAGVGGQRRTD